MVRKSCLSSARADKSVNGTSMYTIAMKSQLHLEKINVCQLFLTSAAVRITLTPLPVHISTTQNGISIYLSNSPTIYRSMLINSEVMLLIMNNPNDGSFQVKSDWISFLTECKMKIPLQPCTYCSCWGSEISNLQREKRNCFLLQFQLCTVSVSIHTGLMKEKPLLILKSVD